MLTDFSILHPHSLEISRRFRIKIISIKADHISFHYSSKIHFSWSIKTPSPRLLSCYCNKMILSGQLCTGDWKYQCDPIARCSSGVYFLEVKRRIKWEDFGRKKPKVLCTGGSYLVAEMTVNIREFTRRGRWDLKWERSVSRCW